MIPFSMELIKAEHLHYNNGSKDILIDASFRILEGMHCGLVGPNGAGKTTVIRLILGDILPDSGGLYVHPGLRIGYVPQKQEYFHTAETGRFMTMEADTAAERLESLEEMMASVTDGTGQGLLEQYARETERFEYYGGYSAEEKAENLLRRLGLDNNMDQPMDSLSGGERSLVYFAKALMTDPGLLVLDEPGNHLDYLGLAWLEAFLANNPCGMLIVSHNRYLLDKTCGYIMSLDRGKLDSYTGNYSRYRSTMLRDAIRQKNEFESSRRARAGLAKKIAELQGIAQSMYNPPARVMNQLAAAKRKYAQELSKNTHLPDLPLSAISLDILGEESKSDIAVRVTGYSLAFGENVLFRNAGMEIHCGERVALVGPNGCGKSSLLKALLSEGCWEHPHLRLGPGQKTGYLSQVPVFAKEARTVEDEVRSWGPLTRNEAYDLVARTGFTYGDMDKPLDVLSGGETSRLQMSRFLYHRVNFLILDEPTNHMDIPARESIEESVRSFEGTVLVVSHDRYFLDSLVDRVVEIRDHVLVSHPGNFSDFFAMRYPVLPGLSGSVNKRGSERNTGRKHSSSVRALETRIENAESEKRLMEKKLESCFEKNDMAEGRKVSAMLEKTGKLLDRLYDEWENMMSEK